MDKFTFGESKAATDFADYLSKLNNIPLQRRISKLLCQNNHLINFIDKNLPIGREKETILTLIRNQFKEILLRNQIIKNAPNQVKSYTLNIFAKNFRMAIANNKNRNNFSKKIK
jgi:hypothetical protein